MQSDLVAAFLSKQPNPIENLSRDQRLAGSGWLVSTKDIAAHFQKTGKRIVALACGHYTLTRALHRARCPRCGAKIRAGYDYDGFRNLGGLDTFHWPEDPLLVLHEGNRAEHDTVTPRALDF